MVLTYIVLTQQVLILCYLGNMLLRTKLLRNVTSIDTFICYYLFFRYVSQGRNYILNVSKFKMCFNWAAYSINPNVTDTQHTNILQN